MSAEDTIAAFAGAPGRGAIGVIRVSGPAVPRIADALLGSCPSPRRAQLSRFLASDGSSLDEGLVLYFPAPASYTGEHVLELQGHGGPVIVDMVLRRLVELGCRLARPGEFSERAFLNGKIDMAQAEAVAALIDAGTTAAARAAVRSLQGEFSARIAELQSLITELRAYVEAAIDFPDEEIDFLNDAALRGRLTRIFAAFESTTAGARQGALLRDGFNVVIAGKPNAGKSSLMNRLAGEEVAIVTDVPGTTRDLLRRQVHLDGLPLNLVDTAGLRPTEDAVEAEGVRRARSEIARADHVLYIIDAQSVARLRDIASAGNDAPADNDAAAGNGASPINVSPDPWAADLDQLPSNIPVTLIFNKIDLIEARAGEDDSRVPPRLFLSAHTGEGVDMLRSHLKEAAGYEDSESGALSARRRHLDALDRARQSVGDATEVLSSTRAFELFAEDLRLAQQALGEITGEFSSDDLLGEIFGSFCIGK